MVALRGFAERIHIASPRRNGAAAFMDCSSLNGKAAFFQREVKVLGGRGLLRVNPNHQHAGGAQELRQPIKRRIEGFRRAPSPIDQHDVVLAGRTATICGGRRASKAAAMQLQHQLDAPGTGDDDSMLLRATCERDHRFDDSIARWSGVRGSHDVTIQVRLLPAAHAGGWTADRRLKRLMQAKCLQAKCLQAKCLQAKCLQDKCLAKC
jgi:hypothetical protein